MHFNGAERHENRSFICKIPVSYDEAVIDLTLLGDGSQR